MTLVQKEPKSIKIGIPHDDYSAMQGPCPDGYHIPTKDEWETVCNIGISLGIWTSSSGDNAKIYLKMPYAGYRSSSNSNLSGQGSYGFYWSCTWYNSSNVYGLLMRSNAFTASGMQSSPNGMSIRPFKDIPTVPDSSWTSLYSNKVYHNSTLGLISLSSDGNTWVTIADKNLGATTVYNNGDTLSEANCGKYYQRGNNYGFPRTGSVTTSSTQVNASTYGPGNYYSSSTFVTRSSSPYSWDSSDNGNLRGGETGIVQKADTDVKKVYLGSTQVRPKPPRTFTISWTEQSNMSSGWTYSDDAAGLTAGSGDFDDFFGYSAVLLNTSGVEAAEMKQTGGVFTGAMTTLGNITSGDNVMIKFPVRGIKMTKSGSVVTLSITEELNKTGYQYYAFCTGTLSNPGTPKNQFYIGAYRGYVQNSYLLSWSGKTPTGNVSQANFCTYAKNNSSNYNILCLYQRMYVNALYMMKYGNPNAQTVIGMGYNSGTGVVTTGGTNNQTSATYGTSSNTSQIKLFGLEDRWGATGEYIGGCYTDSNKLLYAMLSGRSGAMSGGESTGTTVAQTSSYYCLSSIAGTNKAMFAPIGTVGSGAVNQYYCDAAFIAGGTSLFSSGASSGGAEGNRNGPFKWDQTLSPSSAYTYVGARLMYL